MLNSHPQSVPRWQLLLWSLLIALTLWLPRAFELERYVTIDEKRWLTRAANFYQAIESGTYENTFQQGHPGVTVMWAGLAGYVQRFPTYAQEAPGQFDSKDDALEEYLQQRDHTAIELLAAGRSVVVLLNVLLLTLAFAVTAGSIGLLPALAGFLLIASDPFHVAHSRFLHPDGLLPSFVLLSLVCYIAFLLRSQDNQQRRQRGGLLVASGVAAALAWLTKTPGLFLIPFVGLLTLVSFLPIFASEQKDVQRESGSPAQKFVRCVVLPLAIWAAVAAITYLLLWPAMWVDPLGTLRKVFEISSEYANEGHSNALFFNGTVLHGDPGFIFYPINYLWRTTPAILLGLILALVAIIWPKGLPAHRATRATTLMLVAFGLLFMLFMNLGAKKFDRYLLPMFPVFDLAAGIGLAWAATRVTSRFDGWSVLKNRHSSIVTGITLLILISTQAAWTFSTYPYYLSYYNPLLGGAARAPEVMFVGWGEGMDGVARYLNAKEDAQDLTVAAWYNRGPFSFLFAGESDSSQYYWTADYAVSYLNQWQRETPARQLIAYLNRQPPEETIAIDGIDYARIYNVADLGAPDFVVDWGGAIRLVSYTMTTGALNVDEPLRLALYLVNVAPVEKNLNMLVRIVNADGHELLRSDRWPFGAATSNWSIGELWLDRFKFAVDSETPHGLYRVELSIYDPETLDPLPVTSVHSGEFLGETHILDYVLIGDELEEPAQALSPPAKLGGLVSLVGVTQLDDTRARGAPLRTRIFWQTQAHMTINYTAFAHLVGPDGTLIAQQDNPPLNGFVPTRLWYPGQGFVDDYTIDIPPDAPAGAYRLHIGLYDPKTGDRLAITRDGEAAGDSVVVLEIRIE